MNTMKLPIDQIYVFPDLIFSTKGNTRERLEEVLSSLFTRFDNDGVRLIEFLENAQDGRVIKAAEKDLPKKTAKDIIMEAVAETARELKSRDEILSSSPYDEFYVPPTPVECDESLPVPDGAIVSRGKELLDRAYETDRRYGLGGIHATSLTLVSEK